MVLQDFTTWTETDPDACITVTETRVTWTAADGDGDSYVVDDRGAGGIPGDFTHQFEVNIGEMAYLGTIVVWSLSNTADFTNNEDVELKIKDFFGDTTFGIYDWGGELEIESGAITTDTLYFVTIARVTKTYTLTMRTGSHTGNVFYTGNGTQTGDLASRYLWGFVDGTHT